MSRRKNRAPFWHVFDINSIEDLGRAVLGADLEAIQLAGPPARGSIAFAASDGVIFSSGWIWGRVGLSGLLSQEHITLGVGLKFGPGSRLWLNPAGDGEVVVFLPGASCDFLFAEGSLYLSANLSRERFEEEAARAGLVLDRGMISRTGPHALPLARQELNRLRARMVRIHRHTAAREDDGIGHAVLRAVIEHYAQSRADQVIAVGPIGFGRIVHRAREFIRAHLHGPISLDTLAVEAGTSQRTLARAFMEVLEESPASYIRRMRLHCIRRDLVRDTAARHTIRETAAACGIGEPGRMSGWYRELFGEHPSDTRNSQSTRAQLENTSW